MSAWVQGSYEGVISLGKKYSDDYRGYVVLTSEEENLWYAYTFTRGEHQWIAEGTKEEAMAALERVSVSETETRYTVATYSDTCTAYVRTTLRRALALQPTHNVWTGTEYVNAARGMVGVIGWSEILPDADTWSLTKTELMTIHLAIEWRRSRRMADIMDRRIRQSTLDEWAHIEDEIYRVLRGIWHSEGKYWV